MFNIAKYELNFLREFSTFEPSLQHLTTLFWVFSQYNGAQVCVCDCTKLCVTLPFFFRYVIFKIVCVLYETNDWVCMLRTFFMFQTSPKYIYYTLNSRSRRLYRIPHYLEMKLSPLFDFAHLFAIGCLEFPSSRRIFGSSSLFDIAGMSVL